MLQLLGLWKRGSVAWVLRGSRPPRRWYLSNCRRAIVKWSSDTSMCRELAAVACLGVLPYVALACVEVGVFAEDTDIVEVLVAVCWRLVVVPADTVSGVGYGWVYHTWGGVGVAELGGAAVAPWFALLVGGKGSVDIRSAWCDYGCWWCCATSLGVWWWFEVGWFIVGTRVGWVKVVAVGVVEPTMAIVCSRWADG